VTGPYRMSPKSTTHSPSDPLGDWGGALIDYWRRQNASWLKSYYIGFGEPFCFACGWLAPVLDGQPDSWDSAIKKWLFLTHIAGQEDTVENLVPLCATCTQQKRQAGDFESLEHGRQWIAEHYDCDSALQMYTDAKYSPSEN
jgi:hypothetical protein